MNPFKITSFCLSIILNFLLQIKAPKSTIRNDIKASHSSLNLTFLIFFIYSGELRHLILLWRQRRITDESSINHINRTRSPLKRQRIPRHVSVFVYIANFFAAPYFYMYVNFLPKRPKKVIKGNPLCLQFYQAVFFNASRSSSEKVSQHI